MKKLILIRTVVLFASVFFLPASYSQSSSADKIASVGYNKHPPARVSGAISESADGTALMEIRAQNIKMFNDFSSSFKNATDIKMSRENTGTQISCYADSVLNKISYGKKGKWMHTIRYFEVNKLPQDVRGMVNDSYPRYSLFGFAAEVIVPGKTAYLVMIENQHSWKRVRVVHEGVDVYEEYDKP